MFRNQPNVSSILRHGIDKRTTADGFGASHVTASGSIACILRSFLPSLLLLTDAKALTCGRRWTEVLQHLGISRDREEANGVKIERPEAGLINIGFEMHGKNPDMWE